MADAFSIVLIALAAFLLPIVAGRLRIPAVVLEILFGVVVGPSVLNVIQESEVIESLAEIGFFLLMFVSGFEIDFAKLERHGAAAAATGLGVFLLTLGLAWFAADRLGHGPFLVLVLATTSLGLVVPTLRTTGHARTGLGQTILVCAMLADFLTLIGATLYAMIHERGAGWHLLNFPLLFVAIALVLLGLKRLAWWYPEKFERLFAADDPEEMGIRTCLALMFVFVGMSYLLGVEPILGAFLAGTTFALVFPYRGQLERKMTGFSFGFLVPVFFIHVGVTFELWMLFAPGVLLAAVALLAAAFAVKVIGASPLLLRGFRARDTLAAGLLLSTRLSLVIAIAELGTRLELLSPAVRSEVILVAVVTSVACPVLFRGLASRAASSSARG